MKDEINDTLDFDSLNESSNKLPSFLNVLTILTFVGSGLTILGALYNLVTVEQQKETIAMMKSQMGGNQLFGAIFNGDMIQVLEITLENNLLLNGTSIIVGAMCILGAVLMRKFMKNGLYLYFVASIASIIIPTIVFGMGLMGGMMMFGHLFTVAFMVMYVVNFRYLRN